VQPAAVRAHALVAAHNVGKDAATRLTCSHEPRAVNTCRPFTCFRIFILKTPIEFLTEPLNRHRSLTTDCPAWPYLPYYIYHIENKLPKASGSALETQPGSLLGSIGLIDHNYELPFRPHQMEFIKP